MTRVQASRTLRRRSSNIFLSVAVALALAACSASGSSSPNPIQIGPVELVADALLKNADAAQDPTCEAATAAAVTLFRTVVEPSVDRETIKTRGVYSGTRYKANLTTSYGIQLTCAWWVYTTDRNVSYEESSGLYNVGVIVTWSASVLTRGPSCGINAVGCAVKRVGDRDIVVGGLHDDKYTSMQSTDPKGRYLMLQFVTTSSFGESGADYLIADPRLAVTTFMVAARDLTIPVVSAAPGGGE